MSTRFGHSSSFPIVFPEDQQMRLLGINKRHLGYTHTIWFPLHPNKSIFRACTTSIRHERLCRIGDVHNKKIRNCMKLLPMPIFSACTLAVVFKPLNQWNQRWDHICIYAQMVGSPSNIQKVLTWSYLIQSHCAGEFLVSSFHQGHNMT